MRMLLIAAALAVAGQRAQAQQTWISACQGGNNAQYTQIIDGKGSFNLPNGDGTFTTIPVQQSFYDGAIVCGATGSQNESQIAQVCADTDRNVISVLSPVQAAKRLPPQNATIYCNANVNIH